MRIAETIRFTVTGKYLQQLIANDDKQVQAEAENISLSFVVGSLLLQDFG